VNMAKTPIHAKAYLLLLYSEFYMSRQPYRVTIVFQVTVKGLKRSADSETRYLITTYYLNTYFLYDTIYILN
jgi:hypothetical protein